MIDWRVDQADCLAWLASLPVDCADLVFGSPPYEDARAYGIDFDLKGQAWVDWMVRVYQAGLRCCRGLVAFVLQGRTRKYRWSATPALLMADLHRAGVHLRNPPIFHRVGIPGSGGPDWLRGDMEFIVCATRGGKLPWSDNTAMGHKPKWAPGGEMSYRAQDGSRRNEWGCTGHDSSGEGWKKDGTRKTRRSTKGSCVGRRVTRGHTGGDTPNEDAYLPPVKANPGNVIHLKVGGGLMGNRLCHQNEAPFPEKLAEFFIRSFCPPRGLVLDPFCGSGTTGGVAVREGRRFWGCDARESQVELSRRRIAGETPPLF